MDHRFQIDLRGLIDLLSNHLYARDDVFVRELLQNAVDARTALAHLGDVDGPGTVRFDVREPGVLVVRDDGIGLTEPEIHRFLATIGQSSKRLAEGTAREDFLGQFGIGLLACFVVSDAIEVRTRSARSGDAKTWLWQGREDGTYELTEDPRGGLDAPGTEVTLRAKPGHVTAFDHASLRASLGRYGRFLPHRIELVLPGGAERLDQTPPWRRELFDRRAALQLGQEIFHEEFVDAIPLDSQPGGVRGVALILARASAVGARRSDVVYLKGMLLHDAVEHLLPGWAFFVRAVVDVQDLRPLASREAFVENADLEATRGALGACIRDYILGLARRSPERLQELIALHHGPMKLMARSDPELLRLLGPWFPFETSSGRVTLAEFIRGESSIRYADTVDQFRQIAPLVEAAGHPVINAAYGYDLDILKALAATPGFPPLEHVDAASLTDSFSDPTIEERERLADLLSVSDAVLKRFRCEAHVKRFEPARLPAIYATSDDSQFLRDVERSKESSNDLFAGLLSEVNSGAAAGVGRAQLIFNLSNPMVQRLARVDDQALLQRLVEVLYLQTLLLGHHPLSSSETNLLSTSVTGLIEWSLDARGRMLQ